MKRWIKWTAVAVPVAAIGYVLIGVDVRPRVEYAEEPLELVDTVPLPPDAYGIPMSGFVLEKGVVRTGTTFSDLLGQHAVPMPTVSELVAAAAPYFDVRRMRAGHPYAFIFADDSTRTPTYFIYEADPVEYVVFGLTGEPTVRVGQRPVRTSQHRIACAVTGALYNDLERAGADPALAMQLAEVFAWTVDFYRIQKNDTFSVVYSERTVDGERYGRPMILAARYTSAGKEKEAFRFAHDGDEQFYDAEGNSQRKAFLKAPLKFSRISSGFSGRRLHPVQKVMKAHLGTDYAAPYGTPILAVGDGVVEKAGRTGGNGNFVKIRHNTTYSTQYLHMRKILVRQGQRVVQGDVIGEVGSTGLATGPHVCFRFWKNGVQVDHRKEEFPSAEPVPEAARPTFVRLRDSLTQELDAAQEAMASRTVVF
ncbi:MAG: peptidoglycan DD-metalloendopeptidase family protein [Flavobacteriales bacterium]|jgi:murein DD-endopeptidase MepM/ murein hydrolase activator NlpD|nr:peptidoglycan DD-metalloendopeptidase family protein [Flavobacteriales bacterium]MBP7449960.1 peptidoglycan DD-metalloendopeptidase family protein [Flavobacteriales bacterium]HOY27843.1 peptidoglycan DD-metalloendopeptidase family protein [Flavobacteriales bacterium]